MDWPCDQSLIRDPQGLLAFGAFKEVFAGHTSLLRKNVNKTVRDKEMVTSSEPVPKPETGSASATELQDRETKLFGRPGRGWGPDVLANLAYLPDVVGFAKQCLMDKDYGLKEAMFDVLKLHVEVPTFRSAERDFQPDVLEQREWHDRIRYPNREYGFELGRLMPSPVIRSPLADFKGLLRNATTTRCFYAEIKALECLEHFGYNKGKSACSDYLDDYNECTIKPLQTMRIEAMKKQKYKRRLEVLMGERESTGEYPIPKPNAYEEIFHNPRFRYD